MPATRTSSVCSELKDKLFINEYDHEYMYVCVCVCVCIYIYIYSYFMVREVESEANSVSENRLIYFMLSNCTEHSKTIQEYVILT
jgi:hypothetical protein